jgi:NADH dehydrogenase
MKQTGIKRSLVSLNPDALRRLTLYIDQVYRRLPISIYWLDELAMDRITSLDVIPREFGIIPARFKHQIDYLKRD